MCYVLSCLYYYMFKVIWDLRYTARIQEVVRAPCHCHALRAAWSETADPCVRRRARMTGTTGVEI